MKFLFSLAIFAFAFAFGTFYGGFVALAPAVTVDYFGTRSAGATIGVIYSSVAIGPLSDRRSQVTSTMSLVVIASLSLSESSLPLLERFSVWRYRYRNVGARRAMLPRQKRSFDYLFRKLSGSPGRGHGIETNCPVELRVMKAVRKSSPPKQMLVVTTSGIGTCSIDCPSGLMTVIPPL